MFTVGLFMLAGLQRTKTFFLKKKRLPGTICFFFGAFLVIWGWAFIGMIIELIGFINLFKFRLLNICMKKQQNNKAKTTRMIKKSTTTQ